jgi:S1-C subfamily serine protease
MHCTKTWKLLAAAIGLAGCQPAANDSAPNLASVPATVYASGLDALEISSAGLAPIGTPIHIAMQPMQSVGYTMVETNQSDLDAKLIVKGRVWFERNAEGRIEQHKEISSGSLQSKRRRASVDLQLTGLEVTTFEPNGKVWSIAPIDMHMPSTAPSGLSQKGWDSIRKALAPEKPAQGTGQILSCVIGNFTFAKGSIQTGTPVIPTTRREFFDHLADCMIAMVRGDPAPTHPDNIAFRNELMAASESDLPRIHDHVRDTYEQRWTDSFTEYTSDVTVKGMVVKNGQEFAYADGVVRIGRNGEKRMVLRKKVLIDPYSGLTYQTIGTAETADPSEADAELAAFNGETYSLAVDLPSRTPANVTIAEPRKPVAPGGTGTVVDIYNRSIPAIYKVETSDGTGTAFAISDRQAITAAHVVEGAKTVSLISLSGAQLTATVVKRDPARDVALLQLNGAQFPMALSLSPDFAVTGAQVIVIGCPLGACGSVTTGIVSFSARRIQGTALVQIDAQINPGNSGGPILNTNGDVIGIVEEKINPDPNFDGLSFGLSSPEIVGFLGG